MRLTSVTRLSLPEGRLSSYVVRAAGPGGRRIPVSFDQRRHVGEGARPGSWMAVAFRLPVGLDRETLGSAWEAVLERHGTFRTAFDPGADGPVLREVDLVAEGWATHRVPGSTWDAVRRLFDAACSPYERPSHRLCVLEPVDAAEGRPYVIIGSDHAHVDMLSWHVVVRDLLAAAAAIRAGADPVGEPVAAFAEHTVLLERMPPAPEAVRQRWAQILDAGGGSMPAFPLPLGDIERPRAAVVDVREVLDAAGIVRFDAAAAALGVRAIALATSVLTRVTLAQAGTPLRAVFPVHSRHEQRWHDAVGWFITNAVLESADPDPRACADAIREAVALGSYPLAPILAPYGGMPMGPGMFALSWLDGRRLPVPDPPALELQHVSAAIDVDGVMAWFTATEEGLQVRCRYPDTLEARASMDGWLDAVIDGMRRAAASSLSPSLAPTA
jgi:mycolipenoyl-CoA---2-(long-chain-fatty acyl)-trehalose mycolipenoyltransferase / long-chain-acyl-CoA---trehalose acyltransferase